MKSLPYWLSRWVPGRHAPTGLIGLEFGPEGIAVARASVSATSPALSYCAFHPEPRMAEQPALVRKLVTDQQWQGYACNVVLHPTQYQATLVEAPAVEESELREAISWRLRDTFGQNPEDLAFDIYLLPEDAYRGRGRMAVLAAMPASTMAQIVRDITSTGLRLRSIDITESALHNLARRSPGLGEPSASLRLRSSSAMMCIGHSGIPYFSRTLEVGLEPVLREQACAAGPQHSLASLVLEVQRSLDFFESQMRKGRPTVLHLLPTKQPVPTVARALADNLGIDVRPFPMTDWLLPEGDLDTGEQAYCLAAMGAALREVPV